MEPGTYPGTGGAGHKTGPGTEPGMNSGMEPGTRSEGKSGMDHQTGSERKPGMEPTGSEGDPGLEPGTEHRDLHLVRLLSPLGYLGLPPGIFPAQRQGSGCGARAAASPGGRVWFLRVEG